MQSAASDMVCLMMVELDRVFKEKGWECWPINIVHDCIYLSCRGDLVPEVIPVIWDVMTKSPDPNVMLDIDLHVGVRWSSKEETLAHFAEVG